ncbi:MAG: hypothetical protein FOGNACKC_04373 [Anaerolineae bacterium]|nr:hypothetical protein [Anaerolineae bacterium]
MHLVVVGSKWRVASGAFLPAARYLQLAAFLSGEKQKTLTHFKKKRVRQFNRARFFS